MIKKVLASGKQGKIGKVAKAVGDEVKAGDKLMQIESMKGNTIIKSRFTGKVVSVVEDGVEIKSGAVLAEIEVDE